MCEVENNGWLRSRGDSQPIQSLDFQTAAAGEAGRDNACLQLAAVAGPEHAGNLLPAPWRLAEIH